MVPVQRAVLLVACIVLLALAILVAPWATPEPAHGGQEPPAAASGTGAAQEPADAGARRLSPGSRTAVAGTRPADGRRPDGTPATRVTVRVVDPDDRPVARAAASYDVQRTDEPAVTDEVREQRTWQERATRTDERGELHIEEPTEEAWLVYARHEGMWGSLHIPLAQAGTVHVLRLEPDRSLEVQVLQGELPLAGVLVSMVPAKDANDENLGATEITAGPDGIATFWHLQATVQKRFGDDVVVRLESPLPERVMQSVDLRAPPARPIVLRLPATGSLRITAVVAPGKPYEPGQDEVYARLHYEAASPAAPARSFWRPLLGSVLSLPHVGLGLRFRLVLESTACRGGLEFAGPTQPGERIELELPVTVHALLAGRLVNGQGEPQQGYWFASHVHQGFGYLNQYFVTSADGLFQIGLPELELLRGDERTVIFRRTRAREGLEARVDLRTSVLAAGINRLGDVVLRPQPLIAEGVVVDDKGLPVGEAKLDVRQSDEDRPWHLEADKSWWVSDAKGRFRITGHALVRDLRLSAAKAGHLGGDLPFVRGQRDLRYVLSRAGGIEAAVRLPKGMRAEQLVFVLADLRTGKTRGRDGGSSVKESVLRWEPLAPGHYAFQVQAVGSPEPLLALPDVTVKCGEVTRLPDLVIGDGVRRIGVRLESRDGSQVLRASVLVDPDHRTDRPRAALTTAVGTVDVWTTRPSLELLVLAPGFRQRRVPAVTADVTVVLEPGLPVELRVRLVGGDPLAAEWHLFPRLRHYDPADPDPSPWRSGHYLALGAGGAVWYPSDHASLWREEVKLDAARRALLQVPEPGRYAVEWRVGAKQRDLDFDLDLPAQAFTVVETERCQVVEVELQAAALAASIRRAQQD